MAFEIERFDYTQPDTSYRAMPKSRQTVEAERLYSYCVLEAQRQEGKLGCFWNREGKKHLKES